MSQARRKSPFLCGYFRVCLHGGGGPQIGEVTRGGSPHLSCKRDKINMRDCMDRRVTSPTWGPPLPCKQSLSQRVSVRRVLVRIPFVARHPVPWCCILMHPPAHPLPPSPSRSISIISVGRELEFWTVGRALRPRPTRTTTKVSVWVIPSLGGDVLLSHVN